LFQPFGPCSGRFPSAWASSLLHRFSRVSASFSVSHDTEILVTLPHRQRRGARARQRNKGTGRFM
jgi:hypothetical protein